MLRWEGQYWRAAAARPWRLQYPASSQTRTRRWSIPSGWYASGIRRDSPGSSGSSSTTCSCISRDLQSSWRSGGGGSVRQGDDGHLQTEQEVLMGWLGWEDSDDRDASPTDAGQDEGEDGSADDVTVHYIDGTEDKFRSGDWQYRDGILEMTEEDGNITLISFHQVKKVTIRSPNTIQGDKP